MAHATKSGPSHVFTDCGNASDEELRSAYCVRHPEIRTVADYAAFMNEIAPWEDSN